MPWFYKRVLHNLKDHKNEKRMSEEEKELEYLSAFGMCVYLSYLRVLMQLLLASSTWAQTCTPDSNSIDMIIPNADLPTEGELIMIY